jgi:nicotinate-nucleotide pyrophosphorylase (carboxylating)
MFVPRKTLEKRLQRMLAEDVGQGDITTATIIPANSTVEAEVMAKEAGVAAGIEEARILLESLGLEVEALIVDGEGIRPKQTLMRVSGDTRTILSAERTVLNILSRMSGIATTTARLVGRLRKAGLKTKLACTRKTAPGLLYFDKKAVLIGGGETHRLHLDDMILIKDNHIALVGNIETAIKKARQDASFSKKIEVEATKPEDVLIAARAGADIVMLDNFSPKQVEMAIKLLKKVGLIGKVLLEASGGITEQNILDYAPKVDIVSMGELTDSAHALDISLEVVKAKTK